MTTARSDQAAVNRTLNTPALGTMLSPQPCQKSRLRPHAPAPSAHPWAVSMSGGGFRATFAALGAVRLIAGIHQLSQLRYASSVSGGSIANGMLAVAWPQLRQRGFDAAAVDELVIDPTVRKVSARSLKVALLTNLWRTVGPRTRTDLLAEKFDEWFFARRRLSELDPEVRWIINAANLSSGVRFGFERDVLGDYTIGLAPTEPAGILLSTAVAASAAVPGAFAPVKVAAVDFPCATYPPMLMDGGVYDNTGIQALDRENQREVFLVSMSAGGLLRPGAYGRVPLVRDLARANSMLYRQSTAIRTQALVERFNLAGRTPAGAPLPDGARRGVLVALATTFPEPSTGRFDEWQEAFPERRSHGGHDLASVPTVFDKLDEPLCRALVYRGWWLIGAALATYHPSLIPPDISELDPPALG
jgi:NTE family protein